MISILYLDNNTQMWVILPNSPEFKSESEALEYMVKRKLTRLTFKFVNKLNADSSAES